MRDAALRRQAARVPRRPQPHTGAARLPTHDRADGRRPGRLRGGAPPHRDPATPGVTPLRLTNCRVPVHTPPTAITPRSPLVSAVMHSFHTPYDGVLLLQRHPRRSVPPT